MANGTVWEEVVARLRLESAEFVSGLEQAKAELEAFAKTAKGTAKGAAAEWVAMGKSQKQILDLMAKAHVGEEKALLAVESAYSRVAKAMFEAGAPLEMVQKSLQDLGASGTTAKYVASDMAAAMGVLAPAAKKAAVAIDEVSKVTETAADRWKSTGQTALDYAQTIDDTSMTQTQMRDQMLEMGFAAGETDEALSQLETTTGRVDFSFQGLIKSVKWAIWRFGTALIIYQALRKAIRAVNEAIQEAIRLYKEWRQAGEQLNAVLILWEKTTGEFIGTQKEWLDYADQLSIQFAVSANAIVQAINKIIGVSRGMDLTREQLEWLIELMALVASRAIEPEQAIERLADAYEDAIAGRSVVALEELLQVPLTEAMKEAEAAIDEAGDEIDEYARRNIRLAVILREIEGQVLETSDTMRTGAEDAARTTQMQIEQMERALGGALTNFELLKSELKLLATAIAGVIGLLAYIPMALAAGLRAALSFVHGLTEAFPDLQHAIERSLKETIEFMDFWGFRKWAEGLFGEDWVEYFLGPMEEVQAETITTGDLWDDFVQKWKAGAEAAGEAVEGLADDLFRAIWAFQQAVAAMDLSGELEDLWEDAAKAEEKLIKRYDERAEDLRQRALDRIARLTERATQRREDAEADLHLRLKHMEEDYLLAVKQLREQYVMDIEEAARKRDWRAIRTLQRRYGLEKKQRKEDYQLRRKQFIESWKQRQKTTQKQLDLEIKRINEALEKELKALEEERKEELQEIRDSYAEREAELRQQHAQQYQDLKDSLERQLAEIIGRWITEEDLTETQARAITRLLADQYPVREQDIWDHVKEYVKAVEWWRDSVLALMGDVFGPWPFPTEPWPTPAPVPPAPSPTPTPTPQTAEERCLALWPDYYWTGTRCVRALRMAKGGSFVTSGPTTVRVGEAGPELVTAIPLQKGGSVLAGMRSYIGGDFRLTIDGTQAGMWGVDFEGNVLNIVRDIFEEALER